MSEEPAPEGQAPVEPAPEGQAPVEPVPEGQAPVITSEPAETSEVKKPSVEFKLDVSESKDAGNMIPKLDSKKQGDAIQTPASDNKGGKLSQIIPPINNYTINLLTLTDEEELILKTVLKKDEEFIQELNAKVRVLRKEIITLNEKSVAKPNEKKPTDASRKCIRCRRKLGIWRTAVPIIDKGIICQRCRFRVCKACRHKQANGLWMCTLCVRYSSLRLEDFIQST